MQPLRGHSHVVTSIVFNSKGTLLVSASMHSPIIVWELREGANACEKHRLEGHTVGVYTLSLSRDDRFIASASFDNTIRLWSLSTGQPIKVLTCVYEVGNLSNYFDVIWLPDGHAIMGSRVDPITNRLSLSIWKVDVQVCVAVVFLCLCFERMCE